MNPELIPGLVLLGGLAALAAAAAGRWRRWHRGRPAAVDVAAGLLAAPRRYLVQVHDAVSRDPIGAERPQHRGRYTAALHMLTAGGFVAATALGLGVHLLGIGGRPLAWLLLAALAAMAAGTALVAARRWLGPRPERLSGGSYDRLPGALAGFVVFLGITTAPAAGLSGPLPWAGPFGVLLAALGIWSALELYPAVGRGALRHALNGFLHLAFHPRPARFRDQALDTALQPLDLEAPRLGAETPADFPWNRLLAFDACVECGRCEAACPAFEAGLPLNPKKLIQDLARAEIPGEGDWRYRGSPHPDRPAGGSGGPERPLVGADAPIHPDTLWACTTCRACVYECPMMIEHVDAVVDLRRFQTLEAGAVPGKASVLLDELRATDTQSGRRLAARLDWAADLAIPRACAERDTELLLWVGEGAFELRNQRSLRALARLLRHAGVDFAVLGEAELDCGDIARRLGDEATFQDLARRNIQALEAVRFRRIVTADPHALHALANEYPALGGRYDVVHHTTLLAELLEQGRLTVRTPFAGRLTYHDPCYLGRYNGETEAPRALLRALGAAPAEMAKAGLRSSCCGSGGGMAVVDVPGRRRIADVRMDHARATGAGTVAVACPHCATMLEGVVQPRPEVNDVAELLLQAVEGRS